MSRGATTLVPSAFSWAPGNGYTWTPAAFGTLGRWTLDFLLGLGTEAKKYGSAKRITQNEIEYNIEEQLTPPEHPDQLNGFATRRMVAERPWYRRGAE